MVLICPKDQFKIDFSGPLRELEVIVYEEMQWKGSFYRQGRYLSSNDHIYADDTILLVLDTTSNARRKNTEVSRLWPYISLILRVYVFFVIFGGEINVWIIAGACLAYMIYNSQIVFHDAPQEGSFQSLLQVIRSFFLTLVPGLTDADPGRLMMEMNEQQQQQERLVQ